MPINRNMASVQYARRLRIPLLLFFIFSEQYDRMESARRESVRTLILAEHSKAAFSESFLYLFMKMTLSTYYMLSPGSSMAKLPFHFVSSSTVHNIYSFSTRLFAEFQFQLIANHGETPSRWRATGWRDSMGSRFFNIWFPDMCKNANLL